jgi:exodeoxyribonuclease V gamma subunit
MVIPDLPGESVFEREVMVWKVFGLLPQVAGWRGFEEIRNYIGDGGDGRKRLQLAAKIANLFDQYLIFRPQLIHAWERGADPHWQAQLWREMSQPRKPDHSATLHEAFAMRLKSREVKLETLHERIAVFGISALPPFYLELLGTLSARMELHFFLLQPSKEYWGTVVSPHESERILKAGVRGASTGKELHLETGNRLLASMGKLGRDFLNLVLETGDWVEDSAFVEPGEDTLLHAIQSDILHLHDRGREASDFGSRISDFEAQTYTEAVLRPKLEIRPDDDSVQIHSCHSPMREMEVLSDHLLDWFVSDPTLTPREVLVMTPDIEAYAPFIQGVFDAPEDEARRIPFQLADCSTLRQSAVASTFLQLLNLPSARMTTTEVLAPLETRVVREKFGLSEGDLELFRRWVKSTNIRWGMDAEHRRQLGLPQFPEHTWRFGLDRLLLGYAMAGRGEKMFGNIVPFDDVEGAAAETLGRSAEYLDRLVSTVRALQKPRRMPDWERILLDLLDTFFLHDDETHIELLEVRAIVRKISHDAALAGFDEPVELAVMLEPLTQQLREDRFGTGFLTGGVTFCALKPMRSIPFRIICLVGMNDGAFPRATPRLAFDLMAQRPRPGDRSVREDDRYLFLETLLSARDRLYISYVGQSQRDNSESPPSAVVSELTDYVAQGFALPGRDILKDHVLTKHRLQAFSPPYFDSSDKRLFSYSAANCAAGQQARRNRVGPPPFIATPLPEPGPEWRAVTLADLEEFFCNPAKFIVTRRLGLRLPYEDKPLEERELFTLDPLEAYSIRQQLVERKLQNRDLAADYELFKSTGLLPPGEWGSASYRGLCDEAERFVAKLTARIGAGFQPSVAIDVQVGSFRVTGQFTRLTERGLLNYRCAGVKAKDMIRHWIQHVALNAACKAGRAVPCAPSGQRARSARPTIELSSLLVGLDVAQHYGTVDQAGEILSSLLELYWRGLSLPLKFFPESARAFVEAEPKRHDGKAKKEPLPAALQTWEGDSFGNIRAEKNDGYFDLCFRNADPLDMEFERTAHGVFGPLLEHMEEEKQ